MRSCRLLLGLAALQPHGVALGCAPCRRRFKSFGGKTQVAAQGGAAATFSPPPFAGVRKAAGAGLAPIRQPPPHRTPAELVCRVEV